MEEKEKVSAEFDDSIEVDVPLDAKEDRANEEYTATNIQVLEGLEAVRKRPGMYIGTTAGPGLHHLVWEIVDNAIDEALAGYCDKIEVTINKGDTITVTDNGRGIPVDIVAKSGLSGVETVYTILHAGGKFGEGGGYKVSGGLHGVGASVVNALSEWLEVTVHKNGGIYYIKFGRGGKPLDHLKRIGDCSDRGTMVTFKPDPTIFTETTVFDYDIICDHLRQMAYLNKGVKIVVNDDRGDTRKTETYVYEGGINQYVRDINLNKGPIMEEVIYCEGRGVYEMSEESKAHITCEVAMQYNESYNPTIFSFCNNIHTHEGGTHEEGFRMAIRRVLNDYARSHKFIKDDQDDFETSDLLEGLTCIISVKHPNPQYEGQTKTKLGNSEVRKIVSQVVGEHLKKFLLENPKVADVIVNKLLTAAKARIAARNARESVRRNTGLELTTLPGKLADCSSKDPSICELFIVEVTPLAVLLRTAVIEIPKPSYHYVERFLTLKKPQLTKHLLMLKLVI